MARSSARSTSFGEPLNCRWARSNSGWAYRLQSWPMEGDSWRSARSASNLKCGIRIERDIELNEPHSIWRPTGPLRQPRRKTRRPGAGLRVDGNGVERSVAWLQQNRRGTAAYFFVRDRQQRRHRRGHSSARVPHPLRVTRRASGEAARLPAPESPGLGCRAPATIALHRLDNTAWLLRRRSPRSGLISVGLFRGLVFNCAVGSGLVRAPDPAETRLQLQEKADTTAEAMGLLLEGLEELDPGRHGLTTAEIICRVFKSPPNPASECIGKLRDAIEALVGKGDARLSRAGHLTVPPTSWRVTAYSCVNLGPKTAASFAKVLRVCLCSPLSANVIVEAATPASLPNSLAVIPASTRSALRRWANVDGRRSMQRTHSTGRL
jgi:hypothetical protein